MGNGGGGTPANVKHEPERTVQGFSVLLVEDDADVRAALASILSEEGYGVFEAADAEGGLAKLRAGGIHVVLTDYQLPPGEDGLWMLKRAAAENLLASTQVLMISAQPRAEGSDGIKWLRKPADIDTVLREVAAALAPVRAAAMLLATESLQNAAATAVVGDSPELILYVNSAAPASVRALHAFDGMQALFDLSQVRVTIWDTSKAPPDLNEPIALVPSLLLRKGAEELRLSGELGPGEIEEFLQRGGLRRS